MGPLRSTRETLYRSTDGGILHARPVPLRAAEHETDLSWEQLERLSNSFRSWPRNRAKRLQQALAAGADETEELLRGFRARQYKLPEVGNKEMSEKGWFGDRTWYWDPLELLDLHVPIDWSEHKSSSTKNPESP